MCHDDMQYIIILCYWYCRWESFSSILPSPSQRIRADTDSAKSEFQPVRSAQPAPRRPARNHERKISPPKPTRPKRECDYGTLPSSAERRTGQGLLPPSTATRGQPERPARSTAGSRSPLRPPRQSDGSSSPLPSQRTTSTSNSPVRPRRTIDRGAAPEARRVDASQNTGYSSDGDSQASGPLPRARRGVSLQPAGDASTEWQTVPAYSSQPDEPEARSRADTRHLREPTQRKHTLSPHRQYQPFRYVLWVKTGIKIVAILRHGLCWIGWICLPLLWSLRTW